MEGMAQDDPGPDFCDEWDEDGGTFTPSGHSHVVAEKCRTRAYPCVGASLSGLRWQRWKEVHPQVQRQGCAQEKTNNSLEKVNVEKGFIMVKELERKERLGVRRLGSQKNHGTQVTFSARVQNKN